jgi:Beta-propeller repeat
LEALESRLCLSSDSPGLSSAAGAFGQLPIAFEPNQGQADPGVDFVARSARSSLALEAGQAVLTIAGADANAPPAVLRIELAGARSAVASGGDPMAGRVNYLLGNDSSRWVTDVPTFGDVSYRGVYQGIDVTYHSSSAQHIEYDFTVAPGSDPRAISMAFGGSDHTAIDENGNLILEVGGTTIVQAPPVAYQDMAGTRHEVSARYAENADGSIGFAVGSYDSAAPLVIDPELVYSGFLGGAGADIGMGIAVDADGAAYVVGSTTSTGFSRASTSPSSHGINAFVAKLTPDGKSLDYLTFLGGTLLGIDNVTTEGRAIAVDDQGRAYITGMTQANNFPIVRPLTGEQSPAGGTPFGQADGSYDAFVTALSADGSTLLFSTYLGGSGEDVGNGVAVDSHGDVAVVGETQSHNSSNTDNPFPTHNAVQPTYGGSGFAPSSGESLDIGDAFVAKLYYPPADVENTNPTAFPEWSYSTYLGGSGGDAAYSVALDAAGALYVAGYTQSPIPLSGAPFPTTPGAFQTGNSNTKSLRSDQAFVAKFAPFGSLVYSTYLGGSSDDVALGIAVDSSGLAYVTGFTLSYATNQGEPGFPTSGNFVPYQKSLAGVRDPNHPTSDAFLSVLSTAGSALVYSTYFGGSGSDAGQSVALDAAGNVYVGGTTESNNLPVVNAIQPFNKGPSTAFVARFHIVERTDQSPLHATLDYSTYVGGSNRDAAEGMAVDACGAVYLTGATLSSDFPSLDPAAPQYGGTDDAEIPILGTYSGPDSISPGDAFVTKLPGNCPAVVGLPVHATRGQIFQGAVALFMPPVPDDDPDHFTATIDWGDGFVTDGSLNAPTVANGPFTVVGNHRYVHPGGYVVAVQVHDLIRQVVFTPSVDVSRRNLSQTNGNIAIDPSNLSRMFVTSNTGSPTKGLFASYSTDGGVTWNGRVMADGHDGLPVSTGSAQLAWDKYGNLFVVYLDDQIQAGVVVALSKDGGKNFTALHIFGTSGGFDQPSIAVGPGFAGQAPDSVWIAMTDVGSREIAVTGAAVTGPGQVDAFLSPQIIAESHSLTPGAPPNYGSIAVGPSGEVITNWEDDAGPNDAGGTDIVVSVDPDGLGPKPFGPPNGPDQSSVATSSRFGNRSSVPAAPFSGADTEANLATDYSFEPNKGRIFMAYTDALPGALNQGSIVRLVFSDDQGKTWSQPVEVDGSGGADSLILPSIAVDRATGDVAVGWYDTRNDINHVKTQYFVAVSTDGGVTFPFATAVGIGPSNATDAKLGKPSLSGAYGQYSGIVFEHGVVHPVWSDNSFGLHDIPDPPQFDIAMASVGVARVEDAPLTLTTVPLDAIENQEASGTVAFIAHPDPLVPADHYTATIDWGDGSITSGDIVTGQDPAGPIAITGSHTYTSSLAYPVVVTVHETVIDPRTNKASVRDATSAVDVSRIAANEATAALAAMPQGAADPSYVVVSNHESAVGFFAARSTNDLDWSSINPKDPLIADGTDGLPAGAITSAPTMIADPGSGNIFLAYNDPSFSDINILVSTDNGQSFQPTPVATIHVGRLGTPVLAVQPTNGSSPGVLWVAYPNFVTATLQAVGIPIAGTGSLGAPNTPEDVPGSNGLFEVGGIDAWNAGQVAVTFEAASGQDTNVEVSVDDDGLGPHGFAAPVTVASAADLPGVIPALGGAPFRASPKVAFSHNLATNNGTLYAAYTGLDGVTGTSTAIIVYASTDFGQTWGDPIAIFATSGAYAFDPALAVDDSTGNVGVAWYDTRGSVNNITTQIYAAVVTAGTEHASDPVALNVGPSNALDPELNRYGQAVQYGGPVALTFRNGVLAAAWSDNSKTLGGNPDVPQFDIAAAVIHVVTVRPAFVAVQAATDDAIEHLEFQKTVGTFKPSNPNLTVDDFSATVSWGDGSVTDAKVEAEADGTFGVLGNYTYEVLGDQTTVVTVYEHKQWVGFAYGLITVAKPFDIGLKPIDTAYRDRPFSGVEAAVFEVPYDADASKYNVTFDWGDGKSARVTLEPDATLFGYRVVVDPETFTQTGHFDGSITVTSTSGESESTALSIDVKDELVVSAKTLHIVAGQTFTGVVGSLVDLDPSATVNDYSTIIDWGDGPPVDTPAVLNDPQGAGFFLTGVHEYATPGQFSVFVGVRRNDGPVDTANGEALVTPPRLMLSSLGIPALTFSNSDTNATADYQIIGTSGKSSDYSATIDWGDGSSPTTAAVTLNGHDVSVDADHVYTTEGVYTASLMLNGPMGATDSESATVDAAADVSSQVTVDGTGLIFNPQTNFYVGTITLTNTGSSSITGPFIDVVLTGLSAGVTLVGASGSTSTGAPYIADAINMNTIAPGQALPPIDVAFSDPSGAPIAYNASVYADPPPWYDAAVANLGATSQSASNVNTPRIGFTQSAEGDGLFVARTPGVSLALDAAGATIMDSASAGAGSSVVMHLVGANPTAHPTPLDPSSATVNYLVGDDPSAWRTGLATFGRVVYSGVFPGIDLLYREGAGGLEYDFVVAPGADPSRIAMRFNGASSLSLNGQGDLVAHTPTGDVTERAPVLYQMARGVTRHVDGQFVIKPDGSVGFSVGAHDPSLPLVIDPVLASSTYYGGLSNDEALKVAEDKNGNVVIVGWTNSFDSLPLKGAIQATSGLGYVAKFDPTGALVFATFFGGTKSSTYVLGVATDTEGSIYLTGDTLSTDFPTVNPIQATLGKPSSPFSTSGPAAFLSKLSPDGSRLIYSTYLGGEASDYGSGVAVDADGAAYLTGYTSSINFPTVNPLFPHLHLDSAGRNTTFDAFVAKVNPQGSALVYSTYLGSDGDDLGGAITVDAAKNIYVSGLTAGGNSSRFPTTPGAPQVGGLAPAITFVSELSPDGSRLVFSTLIGGGDNSDPSPLDLYTETGRVASGVAVDRAGNILVLGTMHGDIAATPGAGGFVSHPTTSSVLHYATPFIAKYNPTGQVVYITPLIPGDVDFDATPKGGNSVGFDLAVDAAGNAYVVGKTTNGQLPTKNPTSATGAALDGLEDAFLMVVNPAGSDLAFSTYLGGSSVDFGYGVSVDAAGLVHVVGETRSLDFPVTPGAFQGSDGGGNSGNTSDAFVTAFSDITSSLTLHPVIQPITATEGAPFQALVVTFDDPRPSATAANFTALIAWGDGTTSAGTVAVDPTRPGHFLVSGAHTYTEDGAKHVTVSVTSTTDGATSSAAHDILVADAPITVVGASVGAVEGASFSGRVATVNDANAFATAGDFSATIDWGDGTSSSGSVVADSSFTGQFAVNGDHLYKHAGAFPVRIAVADAGGSQGNTTAALTVAPQAGKVSFHVTLDTSSIAGQSGVITVQFNPGTIAASSAHASVSAISGLAGAMPATITLITSHLLNLESHPVTFGRRLDFDVTLSMDATSASGRFGSSFALQVLGSDGVAPLLSTDSSGAVFRANLAPNGTATAFVVGSTPDGKPLGAAMNVSDASLTATTNNVSVRRGEVFSGRVASFHDANPFGALTDYVADIDWGDGQHVAGSIQADGHGGFAVTGAHTYTRSGSFAASVAVRDVDGSSVVAPLSVSVSVSDVVVDEFTVTPHPIQAQAGVPTGLVTVATIQRATGVVKVVDFSATIDWGDGQTSPGVVVLDATGATLLVQGNHNFTTTGEFPVGVSVIDNLGRASSVRSQATVVSIASIGDGPTVVSVARLGIHWQPTILVISFDQPLDPSSAQNMNNYVITDRNGRAVPIKSASYDPATQTVTLRPSRRMNFHHRYKLTISGLAPNGVTNARRLPLDGNRDGLPGGDYHAVVSRKNLVLNSPRPKGPRRFK